MISAVQRDRVDGFVETARKSGVPVIAEGRLANDLPSGGFYTTPTLFGPVPRGNSLASDEAFGPVLSAMPFEDEAGAIALANATDYGLVAAVWTRDGGRQTRVARGGQKRAGLHQLLWGRRRRGAPVWRSQKERLWTREGFFWRLRSSASSRLWSRTTPNRQARCPPRP
jgi:Aldehyde dehydrogenase family